MDEVEAQNLNENLLTTCNICGTNDRKFTKPEQFERNPKRGPKMLNKDNTIFILENGTHCCNGIGCNYCNYTFQLGLSLILQV